LAVKKNKQGFAYHMPAKLERGDLTFSEVQKALIKGSKMEAQK
jgi:hypothetical protein